MRALVISLKGMGGAGVLAVMLAAAPYVAGLLLFPRGEVGKSLFWQLGYFPTSLFGCWWIFLYLRTQLAVGGELVLIRRPHAVVQNAVAFAALYSAALALLAVVSGLVRPEFASFIALETVQLIVRAWLFSVLLLAPAVITGSVELGLICAFIYSTANYMMLVGFLPPGWSLSPLTAAGTLGEVAAGNVSALIFIGAGLLLAARVGWRFGD